MSLTWTVKQQTYRQKVVAFNAFKMRRRAVTVSSCWVIWFRPQREIRCYPKHFLQIYLIGNLQKHAYFPNIRNICCLSLNFFSCLKRSYFLTLRRNVTVFRAKYTRYFIQSFFAFTIKNCNWRNLFVFKNQTFLVAIHLSQTFL